MRPTTNTTNMLAYDRYDDSISPNVRTSHPLPVRNGTNVIRAHTMATNMADARNLFPLTLFTISFLAMIADCLKSSNSTYMRAIISTP